MDEFREVTKMIMSEIDKDINVPNKNDSINRQAALDIYDDYNIAVENGDLGAYRRYRKQLLELPPTEAENIEEFKKNLSRTINAGIVATNTKDVYSCGMRNGMRWCKSLLEDDPPKFEDASVYVQPTVDAVPVVHGRWIDLSPRGDSRFMCTVCKWKENVPTCMGEPTIWNFCPCCGARMDGEHHEG